MNSREGMQAPRDSVGPGGTRHLPRAPWMDCPDAPLVGSAVSEIQEVIPTDPQLTQVQSPRDFPRLVGGLIG